RADDDKELAPLLAKARAAADKGADGASLLATREFAPLHEVTAFRGLVRAHASRGAVRITLADEPGQPLTVTGRVQDKNGKPVGDALVYAYHTSSKGWYSDRAPHFGGDSGDHKHARLFGYVRTDAEGHFTLRTIRPGGYPRSTLPEHIHVSIDLGDATVLTTEVLFDDDARLTAEARTRAGHDGFVVTKVSRDAAGTAVSKPELTVDPPPAKK
ncbi:MAG TPA: hypothetical protein VK348_05780, partial [Planctomycetota bacterium]|nr:hypothetical protein [Planctomycetota bacterium]